VLRGYVATTPKARAEVPLVSDKGDPVLAHWQFGLGRALAFTSDARAKWAADWVGWARYRQFWSQAAQWALRKVDAADFNAEVALENGVGTLNVEAIDPQGEFRNFLHLQAVVVDPKGQRQTVRLEQKGPGRYAAEFSGKEVGAYMVNLLDLTNGVVRSQQSLGANLNYSPEFDASDPNLGLLARLAEVGGGRVLDPTVPGDNPFLHDRVRTHQPRDLWWWLCMLAVVLFPIDVGLRRVQFDREELARAWGWVTSRLGFGRRRAGVPSREGMASLLARKEQVRSAQGASPGRSPSPAAADAAVVQPAAALFQPRETPGLPPDPSAPAPPQDPSVGPAGRRDSRRGGGSHQPVARGETSGAKKALNGGGV
jgi:hypothetical protein